MLYLIIILVFTATILSVNISGSLSQHNSGNLDNSVLPYDVVTNPRLRRSLVASPSPIRKPTTSSGFNNWIQSDSATVQFTEISSDSSGQYLVASAASSGNGTAVGSGVYRSTNYGVSFSILSFTNSVPYNTISSSSDGTYLLGTTSNLITFLGYMYVSSNSGAIWSKVTTGIANNGQLQWGSVSMSGDALFMVACTLPNGALNGQVYISSSNGFYWTLTTLPNQNWMSVTISSTISYADSSVIAAASTSATDSGFIYVSTNKGSSWSKTSAPASAWQSITSASTGIYLGAVTAPMGCSPGCYVYISSNSGTRWSNPTTGLLSSIPWQDIISDASFQYLAVAAFGGNIFVSSDFGISFSQVASSRNWYGITSNSNGKLLAVVNGQNIYVDNELQQVFTILIDF